MPLTPGSSSGRGPFPVGWSRRRHWGVSPALSPTSRRWRAAALIVPAIVAGLAQPLPAQAQILDAPARTWGVGPATTTSASVGVPRVLTILVVGDRVFVGGTFSSVVDPAGNSYPVKNLAVFSATTGAADLSFKAGTNNTVTSLASDGSGTLYVGGTFGTVNDVTRKGLAAVDTTTGNLRAWNPALVAPGQVDTLAFSQGAVYAGGNFTAVTGAGGAGTSRPFLAKIVASTGAVDAGWTPAPDDRVRALNVAADGSDRLFVAGDFTSVSSKPATNKLAAVVRSGTGAVNTTFRAGPTNEGNYSPIYDVISDGTRVYVASAGSGGACAALSATTGATLWSDHSNGNMQSVRLSGGLLYCAGHYGGVGSFAELTRSKIAAVDPATGAVAPFAPNVNSSQGPWALASDATRVYMGGDFSKIAGVAQPHFAVFIDTAAKQPPQPPTRATAHVIDDVIRLSWSPPSSDGGSAVMKYKVFRATSPGGQDTSRAPLATISKSIFTFDDTTAGPDDTYHYVVVATNEQGMSAPSNQVSAALGDTSQAVPPGAPGSVVASSSSGQVRLTWNAPTADGGAPVTSYRVHRGTSPGGPRTSVGTVSSPAFDDLSGLTVGATYYYTVTAVNSAGPGQPSPEVSATVTAGTPARPDLTGWVASGPAAELRWAEPADGGSPITKYVVLRDAVQLVTLKVTGAGPMAYSDKTIASGTTAVYQVKAVNAHGSGNLSNRLTITAP